MSVSGWAVIAGVAVLAAFTAAAQTPPSSTAAPHQGPLMSPVSPDIVKDLAPTGTLRVGINLGNIVLAQKDPATGEPKGVTVDLSRELARRLGVPVAFSPFDAAGKVFEALKAGQLDVIYLAIEPVRANEITFTDPYVIIEGVYMVPKGSRLRSVADVDRDGVRIGVNKASAYDLYLTRTLKHAQLVRGDSGVEQFKQQKLEAAGGVKQSIVAYAKTDPDVVVLDGHFMEIRQAMGTPKGREAGARFLNGFIAMMKKTGFVADALKRSGQHDAQVAD
jgi:polar amino acid transport system substrate-binding protein